MYTCVSLIVVPDWKLINILSSADKTCLVWGKTCSGTGNCWLYNGEALRYLLNFTAASECLVKFTIPLEKEYNCFPRANRNAGFRFRHNRHAIRRGRLVFRQRRKDLRRGDRIGGHSRGAGRDALKNVY